MVVRGVNSAGLFTTDSAKFVIVGVTEDLTLQITVADATGTLVSFTEQYSPDNNGIVTLYGLHELARTYMTLPLLYFPSIHEANPSVTVTVQTVSGETLTELFTQKFHYCRQRVSNMDGSYTGFLSRYKTRKVRVHQPTRCAFLNHGQLLQLAVAYRGEDKARYSVIDLLTADDTGKMTILDTSTDNALTFLNTATGGQYTLDDIYYIDAVLRDSDGQMIDRIRHEVDHRHFPQQTVMAFYNLFGAPDSLVLTGKSEREAEMTATFATINGEYLKFDASLDDTFAVQTGYLDTAGQGAARDLATSPEVYTVTDGALQDLVTVTEISAVAIKPVTEPTSFKLTYRLAGGGTETFSRTTESRIFDKTFDYTFD